MLTEVLGPRLAADTGEWGSFAWTEFVLSTPGRESVAAPRRSCGTPWPRRCSASRRSRGRDRRLPDRVRRRRRPPRPARTRFLATLLVAVFGSSSVRYSASGHLNPASRGEAKPEGRRGRLGLRTEARPPRDTRSPIARSSSADDGDLGDVRVFVEHGLDLGAVDVLAAADDDVLHAVDDVEEAVVVDEAEVAACGTSRRANDARPSPRRCSSSPSRPAATERRSRRPRRRRASSPVGVDDAHVGGEVGPADAVGLCRELDPTFVTTADVVSVRP